MVLGVLHGLGSAGLEAGLDKLKGLFQLKPFQVYESMDSTETAQKYKHFVLEICTQLCHRHVL